MNKTTAVAFLKALGATGIAQGVKWVQCRCPLARLRHSKGTDSRPSFAIACSDSKPSYYNCFACGSGSLVELCMQLRGHLPPEADLATALKLATDDEDQPVTLIIKDYEELVEEEKLHAFSEIWLDSFLPAWDVPIAMEYLAKREIPEWVVKRLNLRFDTSLEGIAFPLRDFDGVLRGMRSRILNPEEGGSRYMIYKTGMGEHNPIVWYGEEWIDKELPVVVVESVFDFAKVVQVYRNVLSPLTAGVSLQKAKRIGFSTEVYVIPDADEAGIQLGKKLMKALPNTDIRILPLPENRKDPGECTLKELGDLLHPHVKLDILPDAPPN